MSEIRDERRKQLKRLRRINYDMKPPGLFRPHEKAIKRFSRYGGETFRRLFASETGSRLPVMLDDAEIAKHVFFDSLRHKWELEGALDWYACNATLLLRYAPAACSASTIGIAPYDAPLFDFISDGTHLLQQHNRRLRSSDFNYGIIPTLAERDSRTMRIG